MSRLQVYAAVLCGMVGTVTAQSSGATSITRNADGTIVVNSPSLLLQNTAGLSTSFTGRSASAITPDATAGTMSVQLGKMNLGDQVSVQLTVMGCSNVQYALSAVVLGNGSAVSMEASSSLGVTQDGTDIQFTNYVTPYAVYGLDGGVSAGVRVEVNTDGLSATCTSYSYTTSVRSLMGTFDATYVTSGGTAMTLTTRASLDDVGQAVSAIADMDDTVTALTSRVATLESQLAAALVTLNSTIETLSATSTEVGIVNNRTILYDLLQQAVNRNTAQLTNHSACSGQGLLLDPNTGQCGHPSPAQCRLPTNLPTGVSLAWPGSGPPIVGTIANIQCPAGQYSTSTPTVCLSSGAWSAYTPTCTACPSNCTACTARPGREPACTACASNRILANAHCLTGDGSSQAHPAPNCAVVNQAGLGSGLKWLLPTVGSTPYQSFCLNDNNVNGWGNVYGGGWEILHTQLGGARGGTANRNLRNSVASMAASTMLPVQLPDIRNATGIPTRVAAMSQAYADRAGTAGWQWMKFMAKIQGTVTRGQDAVMVTFPSNMPMNWLFANPQSGNWVCTTMPGTVAVSVNGRDCGQTNKAVFQAGTRSIGLASVRNDRCGQQPNNLINTAGSSWRRIADTNTDNAMRHFFTYVDFSNGRDASRCNYCCWGCSGWSEVVVWAARPNPNA